MGEKSFLIVTTLHPKSLLAGNIRYELFKLYRKSINSINYSNFKVLISSDKEVELDEEYIFLKSASETKEKRLVEVKEHLLKNEYKFDYILRLDDDDIINPFAFQKVNTLNCDVYTDEYHSFLDFETGKIAQQKREWFPNTTILKYELAFENLFLDNALFFNYQHSYWHHYLKEKSINIQYASKSNPLYVRALNKASITSNLDGENVYANYLKGFGNWKSKQFKSFPQILSN